MTATIPERLKINDMIIVDADVHVNMVDPFVKTGITSFSCA
jgi:hypothetical protein